LPPRGSYPPGQPVLVDRSEVQGSIMNGPQLEVHGMKIGRAVGVAS
jgi:hypothetical protein